MKYLHTFCIVVLLAWGCKKSSTTGNHSAGALFPNTIGNSWTYLVNDTSSILFNPPTITQYNMTVSVVDSTQLPGGIKANI